MAQKVFDKDQFPLMKAFDAQRFHPKDLKPDPVLNGRVKLPEIARFKRDFLDPSVGQVQPITIKKVDGMPVIVDGVTRWRAALEISDEGIGPHEGNAFFLKCQYVVAKSPADYFILTIKANIRNDPTPEDNAHNIALLVHNFMLDESDIAERVYGRLTADGKPDVQWVRETLSLNDLTPRALEMLKSGKFTSKAAVALAKLTAEKQEEKLSLVDAGHKLTVAAIKRAAPVNGTGTTSEASPVAPVVRKLNPQAFCDILQQYIDMELPSWISQMTPENAVRTVLGQIKDEVRCGR